MDHDLIDSLKSEIDDKVYHLLSDIDMMSGEAFGLSQDAYEYLQSGGRIDSDLVDDLSARVYDIMCLAETIKSDLDGLTSDLEELEDAEDDDDE